MEISVSMLLDSDGFLRRECPTCERAFKWFDGQTDEQPDDFLEPENYHCPYCGVPSEPDTWWTTAQLDYAEAVAARPIMDELTDELRDILGSSRNNGLFKIEIRAGDPPEAPSPLVEPNDMVMVAPPCHAFEPLKILDTWAGPVHCLICGAPFRVA